MRGARTLTLCAKVIQNLANLSNFGEKEAYMNPMNPYITGREAAMTASIDRAAQAAGVVGERQLGDWESASKRSLAELSTLIHATLASDDVKKDIKDVSGVLP